MYARTHAHTHTHTDTPEEHITRVIVVHGEAGLHYSFRQDLWVNVSTRQVGSINVAMDDNGATED